MNRRHYFNAAMDLARNEPEWLEEVLRHQHPEVDRYIGTTHVRLIKLALRKVGAGYAKGEKT